MTPSRGLVLLQVEVAGRPIWQRLDRSGAMTGEGSMYTKLYARESAMNLVMVTHYATEMFGVQALASHVADRFQLPWDFIREEADLA